MVGSSPVLIAALATGHKIGLIVVAGIFIAFALVSSFVLPRRDPDFPGKHMRAFVAVTVALFVAMLAAVVIFGSEPEEKEPEKTAAPAKALAGNATHGKAFSRVRAAQAATRSTAASSPGPCSRASPARSRRWQTARPPLRTAPTSSARSSTRGSGREVPELRPAERDARGDQAAPDLRRGRERPRGVHRDAEVAPH